MTDLCLYQFAASHYNEKARWALDLKGVPHQRISLLPGPHMSTMKRLTGATTTPALVDGERVVAGSTAILEHLEARFPEPALLPGDPEARERARRIVRDWDERVGPAVRLAKFFEVLEPGYVVGTFGVGQGRARLTAYRLLFPVVGRLMKRRMQIDAEHAAPARELTRQALDFVAKESQATGYLAGDGFGIADLTCAALLMPCVDVVDSGGPAEAATRKRDAWLARWADHPGSEWVRRIYARHRRA